MKCSEGCQKAALSEDASGNSHTGSSRGQVRKGGWLVGNSILWLLDNGTGLLLTSSAHMKQDICTQCPMKYTSSWLLSRCYYCQQYLGLLLGASATLSVAWNSGRDWGMRQKAVARHRNGFVSLTLTPRWPASFRDALSRKTEILSAKIYP